MLRGKPTLGYPSRTDAIMALRAQGKQTPEIAAECGISRQNVRTVERYLASGKLRHDDTHRRTVVLPPALARALAPHAAARDTGPRDLALMILEAVAEGLVDAVLDDEEHKL